MPVPEYKELTSFLSHPWTQLFKLEKKVKIAPVSSICTGQEETKIGFSLHLIQYILRTA